MDFIVVILFFVFLFVLYLMARNTQNSWDDSASYGSFGVWDNTPADSQDEPRSSDFSPDWNWNNSSRGDSFNLFSGGSSYSSRTRYTSSTSSSRSTSRRYNSSGISSSGGFGGSSRPRSLSKSLSSGRVSSSRPVKSTPRHSFPKKSGALKK